MNPRMKSARTPARISARVATALAVAGLAAAVTGAAPSAHAFDAAEYTATTFNGGYVSPPAPPATGTDPALLIGPNQDDQTKEATLPFDFPYFGRLFTKVSVCTNGWVAFGTTTAVDSANATLPTANAPNGFAAALWDDLTTGTAGKVRTFTTGTAPSRVFVVSWEHVGTFGGAAGSDLSFQVKLFEGTGVVELAYSSSGSWGGLSYTAGIESPAGTVGIGAGSTGNNGSGQPTLDWRFTPRQHAVTGTLLRDRPVADASGLGNSTQTGLPVVGIDLELVRADTGEVAARGRPGDDGTFSIVTLGSEAGVLHSLRVVSSGEESRVVDANGATYSHVLATGLAVAGDEAAAGTLTIGAAVDTVVPALRRAVNVQQAARRGFALARAAAAEAVVGTNPAVAVETFPRLDFRFVADTAAANGRTQYIAAVATTPPIVHVHDATANRDPWDDDVILRECGHHVLAAISAYPAALSPRLWDQATSAPAAWADGFGHWFACVVQDRSVFIDTTGATTANVFDLENALPAPRRSPDVTGAIACALWDLVDTTIEGLDDPFQGTNGGAGSTTFEILKTIDLSLDAATTTGYESRKFFDVWRVGAPDLDRASTARVFIHHGALDDDAREPNDSATETSALVAQRTDALILNPYNEDWFSFVFAPSSAAPLQVGFSQSGSTSDAEIQVFDVADTLVATGTNVGAASKVTFVATSDAALPAGTYRARVAWKAGGKATYSLSHFSPLRITHASIPSWTQDRPFKLDLVAEGGIAPYTFTTTLSVPGIAVRLGGAQIAGTPTLAGTYVVHVRVTDASGTGTSAEEDLTFVVNRPLRLPQWFGVRSDDVIAADVGAGGTDPVWTPTSAAPQGFTLVGGDTLRLTGSLTSPRSFDVSGSATDAAGGVVANATSHVVVCAPLPARGAADVAPQAQFGFWFEAFAGTRVNLRFLFRGRGRRPVPVALVNDRGAFVPLRDRKKGDDAAVVDNVDAAGFQVRIHDVELPESGTWFVIFEQSDGAFTGSVRRGGRIREPAEAHGLVVIDPGTEIEAVTFEAGCGARLHVALRGAEVPGAVMPSLQGLLGPDGEDVPRGGVRHRRGGRELSTVFRASPAERGVYTLTMGSDTAGPRVGPIFWRVRIRGGRACAAAF